MRYFFIPGRNKELSKRELFSILKSQIDGKFHLSDEESFYIVEVEVDEEEMTEIFHRLGGFVKFGVIIDPELQLEKLVSSESKSVYGVSGYASSEQAQFVKVVETFRRDFKKRLKERSIRARYIGKGDQNLSSGQIVGNKLLEKGFELVLLQGKKQKIEIGRTLAVQDIEQFSKRDFDKPYVDVEMGVLPPKLARIMLNLAELPEGSTVWDPFCGSGNVLMEGLLLGYNMIGSDIDKEAVFGAEENIKWLAENYDLGETKYTIFENDVLKGERRVQKLLRNTPLDAVVFEPYMGPPQLRNVQFRQAVQLIEQVGELYRALLNTLEHIRKPGIKLVGVFPSYKTSKGWATARLSEIFTSRWKLDNMQNFSEDLHWSRSDSIIRRNLVIARLKD